MGKGNNRSKIVKEGFITWLGLWVVTFFFFFFTLKGEAFWFGIGDERVDYKGWSHGDLMNRVAERKR